MARDDVRAGAYNEVLVIQSYSSTASDYIETGRLRAAVSQAPDGVHGVQHRVQFRTRYRTDLGPQNMILWRGGKHYIQHVLDLEMRKREVTIFAYDGIPMSFTPSTSGGTFSAKTAAAYSAGAGAVSLNTLQTGLSAVAANDYFTVSPYSQRFTISAPVTASAGALTNVPFGPGLTGAAASGAAVTITRAAAAATSYKVFGDVDQYAAQELAGTQILATDVKLFVLVQQLASAGYAGTPTINDKMLVNGRTRTILDVATVFHDGAPIAYQMQAR